jgi:hypothetical protein
MCSWITQSYLKVAFPISNFVVSPDPLTQSKRGHDNRVAIGHEDVGKGNNKTMWNNRSLEERLAVWFLEEPTAALGLR